MQVAFNPTTHSHQGGGIMIEPDKPLFTDHLTAGENLVSIRQTHLGQAHFAGTGPSGKTCRECTKWQMRDMDDQRIAYRYTGGDRRGWLAIGPAKCVHPILNKADRLIPADAGACRFFDQSDLPPAPYRRDGRFKKEMKA